MAAFRRILIRPTSIGVATRFGRVYLIEVRRLEDEVAEVVGENLEEGQSGENLMERQGDRDSVTEEEQEQEEGSPESAWSKWPDFRDSIRIFVVEIRGHAVLSLPAASRKHIVLNK